VKLQAYKRISAVRDEATKEAVLSELHDRFGSVPEAVLTLMHAAWLRHLGEAAGLDEIKLEEERAYFTYRKAPEGLMKRVFKASERAHSLGADLVTDMKAAPRLKLIPPAGASEQDLFEAAAETLRALSE